MIDFLRNLTKSSEEKQAEQLQAYVDGELSAREKNTLESQLATDETLQAEVERLRTYKQTLRSMPQYRVPRNFTLDPALYGPPEKDSFLQFYPALRVATVLTAFFLMLTIGLDIFTNMSSSSDSASVPSTAIEQDGGQVAMQPPPMATLTMDTKMNSAETEEAEAEMADEEMMDEEEMAADEEMMDEEEIMVEEESVLEEPSLAEESTAEEAVDVMGDFSSPTDEQSTEMMEEGAMDDLAPPSDEDSDTMGIMGDDMSSSNIAEPEPTATPVTLGTSIPSPRVDEQSIPDDRLEFESDALLTMPLTSTFNRSFAESANGVLDPYILTPTPEVLMFSDSQQVSGSSLPPLRWTQIILAVLLVLFLAMQGVLSRRIK